jgi:hypothetical protein
MREVMEMVSGSFPKRLHFAPAPVLKGAARSSRGAGFGQNLELF